MKKRRKDKKWKIYEDGHGPTNQHHRRPKSRGGTNSARNISRVPITHHNAYNLLFGSNPLPHEVARVLSDTWIDPDYEIIVQRKGGESCKTEPTPRMPSSSAHASASTALASGMHCTSCHEVKNSQGVCRTKVLLRSLVPALNVLLQQETACFQ